MRHEQLLGQTLPCPKCKEPIAVPIAAPKTIEPKAKANTATPGNASLFAAVPRTGPKIIDSTALTKVGDVDWNDLLANEDLSTRVDNGDGSPRFRSLNEPDFIPIPTTFTPISPTSESSKLIRQQALQSTDTAKRRQVVTMATIGISGSLLAVGLFVAFIRMVGTKPTAIAKDNVAQQKLPELNKPEVNRPSVPSETETKTAQPDGAPPNAVDDQGTPVPNPEFAPPSNPPSNTPAANPTSTPPVPNPPQPDTNRKVVDKPTPTEDEDESIRSMFALDSFKPLLLGNGNANLNISDINSAPQDLNIEDGAVYQAQVFHPLPKAIPIWNDASKFVLGSFRKKDISLVRCIDLLGRMTGIGITLDWQSCRVAGIDLAKKISIDEKEKSIAELMEKIIQENDLEWTLDGLGLPVVSASKAAAAAKATTDWSIAGLFPAGSEREGCDALIQLWGYESICSYSDSRLQWTEQATPIEKANMEASLCELALVQKVDASNPWIKASETPLVFSPGKWNTSFNALERKIRPNVFTTESRPIPDLLMTAAAETNLTLVIDWQNVWSHGMTPKETAAIVFAGRTFPQTAKRFLTDYALELVPIMEDTVWLTTREARRGLVRVVPVRLPKNSKIDDLRQFLRILAPVVNDRAKFKVMPIPGTDDLFFARICTPRADQLSDPDVILGLGWPERE